MASCHTHWFLEFSVSSHLARLLDEPLGLHSYSFCPSPSHMEWWHQSLNTAAFVPMQEPSGELLYIGALWSTYFYINIPESWFPTHLYIFFSLWEEDVQWYRSQEISEVFMVSMNTSYTFSLVEVQLKGHELGIQCQVVNPEITTMSSCKENTVIAGIWVIAGSLHVWEFDPQCKVLQGRVEPLEGTWNYTSLGQSGHAGIHVVQWEEGEHSEEKRHPPKDAPRLMPCGSTPSTSEPASRKAIVITCDPQCYSP